MSDHRNSTTAPKSIGELSENIVGKINTSRPTSLQAAIHRYRGEWNLYLAEGLEAAERGESDDIPCRFEQSMRALENWDRPAETIVEAMMALELAAEDYEAGETPRIPAMIGAALGWISAEQKRRAA